MKLNKEQFCTAVDAYRKMADEESDILDTLGINSEWAPSEWITKYYELLTEMCELEENPYSGTDLDWFCYDTDFGRDEEYRKVYDTVTKRTWDIRNAEILYDYIIEHDK